jgi:4-phosphopantoate--beta-alanine ligase
LIGEKTISLADKAEQIAASILLCAKNPVISVNGNVVALVAKDIIELSNLIPAKLEVNLFHRTDERVDKIISELEKQGAKKVYGKLADARIPDLDHNRGLCDKYGIYSSDVVLVPLEDGDRCKALKSMGKTVIAIDLNPLSRTAQSADITIVDNVIRAIPNISKWIKKLKKEDLKTLKDMVNSWDNKDMLSNVSAFISKRLNSLF